MKKEANEWKEYLKSQNYKGSPRSKKAIRQYYRDCKKRKKKLLNYIRKHYCEFGPDMILEINAILINNLFEYHNKGLNIWAADDFHNKTMETLTVAKDAINELKTAVIDDPSYDKEKIDALKTKLFDAIFNGYNSWSD
jgi:hypothetical protein